MDGNNFYNYFPPRHPRFGDPLRNPYEQGFRTPVGFPPRPRHSSTGSSPRHPQQNPGYGAKRSFPYSNDQSPNPYSKTSPFSGHQDMSNYSPNPNWNSSRGSSCSSNSPNYANRSYTTPRNTHHRRQPYHGDSNPGSSSDIRAYYNPSMVDDPWKNLKPVKATPFTPQHH